MIRTIAWLKKELDKFPDDAVCFAYEGEVVGIIVEHADRNGGQGFIYCSESDIDHDSELLPSRP